jgi:hypothetical protein
MCSEWTSKEKVSVQQLFSIVYPIGEADTWKQLLRLTDFLGKQPNNAGWKPWQVAQALIFAQMWHWPLEVWRENTSHLRQWQVSNPNCTVTPVSNPALIYSLCRFLERHGMVPKT